MSVFQPQVEPGSRGAGDPPAFNVVRRGYDPQQVHAYLAEFAARLEVAGEQAAKAEQARAELEREAAAAQGKKSGSFEQLGAEAAALLEQAAREAAVVLEQAGRSAELLVEKARDRAKTVVEEARAHAAELVSAAEQEAEEFEASARQRLVEVQGETEQVRAFREGLLHYLGRVRADIDTLLEKAASEPDRVPPPASARRRETGAAADAADEAPAPPAGAAEPEQLQPVETAGNGAGSPG